MAIDDEPLALAQITGYITKTPFLELASAQTNAFDAMRLLRETESSVDLLFVDINMPDMSGLDFVRSLRYHPLVIFTTAYAEYALDGFQVDALDYLLKPIGYPDFLRSAEKAFRQYKLLMNEKSPLPENDMKKLFVKSEHKMIQIDISAITHIESRSEYLRIYTEPTPPVMTLGSLKSLEEKLPSTHFMRVHRSYIVNLQKITTIERNHILIPPYQIPIGDQYNEPFRAYLALHSF
jgi:two-component system LytT family response regulator